jgi:hypothetical protein
MLRVNSGRDLTTRFTWMKIYPGVYPEPVEWLETTTLESEFFE